MMLGHWTELPGSSEASRIALLEKHLPAVQEIWIQFLDQEVPLEKEMATCSGIPAWKVPRTEEPDGLQSVGLQRIRHNLATKHQQHLLIMTCPNFKLMTCHF